MSDRIEFRYARRLIAALVLVAALLCGTTPASAADKASSPEDRARFVSITRQLEQAPLKPGLKADRTWALAWLTDAPDVSVLVCTDAIGGLLQSDYRYSGDLLTQYMFSMAAQIIEHPETSSDPIVQQLAGVEGVLTAYRSILRDQPEAGSSALEEMLQTRTRGELPDFVRQAYNSCTKNQ